MSYKDVFRRSAKIIGYPSIITTGLAVGVILQNALIQGNTLNSESLQVLADAFSFLKESNSALVSSLGTIATFATPVTASIFAVNQIEKRTGPQNTNEM